MLWRGNPHVLFNNRMKHQYVASIPARSRSESSPFQANPLATSTSSAGPDQPLGWSGWLSFTDSENSIHDHAAAIGASVSGSGITCITRDHHAAHRVVAARKPD
jgi:hypothetical protein